MPSMNGRLYQIVSSSMMRGVSDQTRPPSSVSDFFRRVTSETRIVTTKQVVQAKMAVQKFCAISLGIDSQDMTEPAAFDQGLRARRLGQAMMNRRRQDSAEQADERAMSGRAPPEHAEQEGGEKRSVHESEHQLEQIHDVVELRGEIGRADGDDDADDGGRASHPQEGWNRWPSAADTPGRCRRSRRC